MRWRLLATAVSFLVALLGAGCFGGGDGEDPGVPGDPAGLEGAQGEVNFPLLWIGRRFAGTHFTYVQGKRDKALLIYGLCEPPADDLDKCSPRYELEERTACGRFQVVDEGALDGATGGPGRSMVYEDAGGTVVLTGRTYVKIFGIHPLRLARALRPLGQKRLDGLLPAPAPGVLERRGCG
jgi:hypothetical protein